MHTITKLAFASLMLVPSLMALQTKTVTDYWKTHANKKDVVLNSLETDSKNDYISYGGTWEGGGEFAVWRKKDGTDLIGQTNYGCGPVCTTTSLTFVQSNKKDVTSKVLPRISKAQERQFTALYNKASGDTVEGVSYYLKFPRKGTTIKVLVGTHDTDDVLVANYKFNGSKFVFEMAK